jgi:formate hydrogenlyase transcriptional activator
VQAYLTDGALFQRFNTVYTAYFKDPRPTRTTVVVAKLVGDGHIEITATALRDESRLRSGGEAGCLPEDLFYRLNVFPIAIPPLRERVEDIPALAWAFVEKLSRASGKTIEAIASRGLIDLQRYPWPGNVRELRNVIERAMILATTSTSTPAVPRGAFTPSSARSTRLVDVQTRHVTSVLESCGWRIRGINGAAERLGLKPTTLETRMAKLGISRPP